MNKKVISIEIANVHMVEDSYYYSVLQLPAEDYEIQDAMHELRRPMADLRTDNISVYESSRLPSLVGRRLDSPTVDELNFLARRIADMDENEVAIMQAIAPRFIPEDESEIVSLKDLINMTYGLQSVSVISNVTTDEELGQFVIENDMQDDVSTIPENARYLLDKEAIGRIQRAADGGVYVGNLYVCTEHFEMPNVYDGITLPETPIESPFVFKLLVGESPKATEPNEESAEWISLPTTREEIAKVATRQNEASINDCVYYNFESSIPQITSEDFPMMLDIDKLNSLAYSIADMTFEQQMKFKAALVAEQPNGLSLDGILHISNNLHKYEMSYGCDSNEIFFKQYLREHLDTKFDPLWIDGISCHKAGKELVEHLGVTITPYGAISAYEGSLYKLVQYGKPEEHKILSTQSLSDEKLDVIEVLDRKALFTNGRVLPEELPVGLYAYDLRMSDDHDRFASIEKSVMVNHGGTILLREALDFGESGSILLSPDDEPNFLGEEMTPNEFLKADLDEMFDQSQGGISQC